MGMLIRRYREEAKNAKAKQADEQGHETKKKSQEKGKKKKVKSDGDK